MKEVVIVAAQRTAIGKFGGTLAATPAHSLGATVLKDLLAKTGVAPDHINEVILGQVLTAATGQNPARQAAIEAGLKQETPAMTINKVCGSGLKSVQLATQAIRCGDAEIIVAGGQENMSIAPHALPGSRSGQRMGDWKMTDTMIQDGLWDAFNNYHMGNTAENIAKQRNISKEEQDAFACASQNKAEAAIKAGNFQKEISPVTIPQRKKDPIVFDQDEFPRFGAVLENFSKVPPAFDKQGGSVTAANASGVNDGAAAVMLMSASKARELGLTPLAHIKAYASSGVCPTVMGTGPIPASTTCLEKAQWNIEDLGRIEANEAFAAQAIAVNQAMGWDTEKVNVNGGAIALGHPIGASGCRILVTLLHEMQRNHIKKGLATLCIGGGMGTAMAVER